MEPMMKAGRDTIYVTPKCGRLKKYDIPLYRRGNRYVLHRVIKVLPGKGYNIRGDNCLCTEENVPEDFIIGVLTGFYRNGKEVSLDSFTYKLYSRLWVFFHPVIFAVKRAAGYIKKLFS